MHCNILRCALLEFILSGWQLVLFCQSPVWCDSDSPSSSRRQVSECCLLGNFMTGRRHIYSSWIQKDPFQRVLKHLPGTHEWPPPKPSGSGDAQSCKGAVVHRLTWLCPKNLGSGRAVKAMEGKKAFCAHMLWGLHSAKEQWSYFKDIIDVHWGSGILL